MVQQFYDKVNTQVSMYISSSGVLGRVQFYKFTKCNLKCISIFRVIKITFLGPTLATTKPPRYAEY